ncbi:hypothetical protein ACFE04_028600 [Oxalis oulophora]
MKSDETHSGILQFCDFTKILLLIIAYNYEIDKINAYDINAPLCHNSSLKNGTVGSRKQVHEFDPCTSGYVVSYLNNPGVQVAIHAVNTKWEACSGEMDVVIPVTSSRYAINLFKLLIKST